MKNSPSSAPGRRAPPRIGFQTKVLIPVLAALVLLPLIIGAIVSSALGRQQQESGRADLATAQQVFEASLSNRSRELLVRFRTVANSPSSSRWPTRSPWRRTRPRPAACSAISSN
jgi:hypothetical protein